MAVYEINLFNGHPIIKDGENIILVDTGAPSTIHKTNVLSFCEDNYNCVTNYMGLSVQKISEMLGTEITTLMGADILSNYCVFFDYGFCIVDFEKHTSEGNYVGFENSEINISSFMGIPIIELIVDNQKLKFFLDTGAKLSYIDKAYTSYYDSKGVEEDFYPGIGKFQTEYYEINTIVDNNMQFGKKEFKVKYGNLPTLLQMTLMLGGTNGIIGFDFFNNLKIGLDIKNGKLYYE